MPISPVLASYSDLAYGTALVLYLLAMALHSVEYAAARVPVTALAGAMADGSVATLARPDSMPARGRPERIGRSAVALTGLAVLVHASSLALRGAAIGRVPWANMYEFISAICFVAVAGWLVVLYRQRGAAASLQRLGGFVLLPVVVLMFLGGTVLYARAEPLIPALNSYWITIHVSAAITATGILLVSGVASVLYLAGAPAGSWIGARLPDGATLDRLAYRTAVVALPIWTFAIITGAIWAEAAWGRYWGWDPKETCALVAWVAGFGVMLFNLFFVNIVIAGFHSYAGV
jgi:ABC-type transport system involved in cytochrome c biogenesis permease subunit